MTVMIILATAALIVLHTLDGRQISVNPVLVTSLHEAKSDDAKDKFMTKGVRCSVHTSDGKFVTVTEVCSAVRQMIEESRR